VESVPAGYRGARAGLIANPASVDRAFVHALDRLAACRELDLVAAFGPQHGARGDRQDNMVESEDFFDARLSIPVHSLYGDHRKPTAAMLEDVDVLFCDLPDAGIRPYTFLSTMRLALEACAELGKPFVVLDRPNPIGGTRVEGPMLDPRFASFIGAAPVPLRHGMTLGELARFLRAEAYPAAALDVIPMDGWRRAYWQDETALPWVLPSPNLPTLDTATAYPGTVLVEGTNLSEGRGTTRPFEIIGAPFLDAERFAARLNAFGLAGVRFRAAWFRPTFDKWADRLCGGAQLHVTDRARFRPLRAGLAVLLAARELAPREFAWRPPPFEYEHERLPIDILAGTDRLRLLVEHGAGPDAIEEGWSAEVAAFVERRAPHLLYP
jgi:uncharacterized protein YbbC (DUF1343 family)